MPANNEPTNRVNIGNARIQGLAADLHLHGCQLLIIKFIL